MYCSKCGKPLPEGGTFCPYCGAAQISLPNEPVAHTEKIIHKKTLKPYQIILIVIAAIGLIIGAYFVFFYRPAPNPYPLNDTYEDSQTDDELIVGKWISNENEMEFFSDGSVIYKEAKYTLSGNWSIVDGKLKIVFDPFMGQTIAHAVDYMLYDDTLTITDEEGNEEVWTRE